MPHDICKKVYLCSLPYFYSKIYASFWLWIVVLASLGAVALPDGRVIMCGGGYIELAEGGRVSTKVGWPERVVKKPNLNVVTFISKWSIVSTN